MITGDEVLREAAFEHFTIKPMYLARRWNARGIRARQEASKKDFKVLSYNLRYYVVTKTKFFKDRQVLKVFGSIQELEEYVGMVPEPMNPPMDGASAQSRLHRCNVLASRNEMSVEKILTGVYKDRYVLWWWRANPDLNRFSGGSKKTSHRVSPEGGYSLDELEDFLDFGEKP